MTLDRRKFDITFTTLLIIASLVILLDDGLVEGGAETDLGSMFLPRIVAIFIILFSGTIAVQSLRLLCKGALLGEHERVDLGGYVGVAIYVAILLAYGVAMPQVGFLLATPVAMFAIAWLLCGRNWLVLAIYSVVTSVSVYFGCRIFLRIFLPAWSLS